MNLPPMFFSHVPSILALRAGPLEFGNPVWLWALLLLAPIIYLWKTSRVPGTPVRRWVALSFRIGLVLALVFALADTRMTWFNKGICVVFVLDQSQSVPGSAREAVRGRIHDEVESMTKDDRYAIVQFGGDAVLESVPGPKGPLPPPAAVADSGHTNIARALRLAMASFPSDRQKRIVLFSDGNQNEEDAVREARIAGVKDIDVQVLMLAAERGHEVMVDQLIVPPHVQKDAHFNLRAITSADIAQTARLVVTRDGTPISTLPVELKAGSNVIDVPDQLSDGGNHQYQVTILPDREENDTFAANNTGYAFTQVDAPGKVLLVRGATNTSTALYDALKGVNVPVVQVGVSGLPGTVAELAAYDCVILDNVNRFDIDNTPQIPALKDWVTKYGGGLVMIGGDNSFGPGGYKATALEEIAPVEMDVRRQKHLASIALVIVMDKSGSMGASANGGPALTKMDLANRGAVEALKILEPSDEAMVGAVDTETKWMLDGRLKTMTPVNRNRMSDEIQAVRAGGGGIYCETALADAYDLINSPGVNAMSKHVIMFADAADSEQQDNCVRMAQANFARFGVTTSVIGLGTKSDPHYGFQTEVARAGGGRNVVTDDAMSLPRIFVKEAFMVNRKAFVENKEGITPTLYPSPILEGFNTPGAGGIPKVLGYVGTTLKPRATIAMHGEEADDPLLAHWSIGLGRCVAYTSDSGSRWGQAWIDWNGYAKFWSQVIRWSSRSTVTSGMSTTTILDGTEGRIIVDATDPATGKPVNNLQLGASVIAPNRIGVNSGDERQVPLEQIAPGRYQAKFPAGQRGTYLVGVSENRDGQNSLVTTAGGVLSYPPEYRDLSPNAALLRSIADASRGEYRASIEGIFQQKPDPVHTYWPLWQIMLICGTGGLFGDIAWRRLNMADWFRRQASQGMPVLTHSDASLGAFKAIKSGRRDVDLQHKSLRERIEASAARESASIAPTIAGTAVIDVPGDAPPVDLQPGGGATPEEAGYTNRLLSAKKRAKDQIREQERNKPAPPAA